MALEKRVHQAASVGIKAEHCKRNVCSCLSVVFVVVDTL